VEAGPSILLIISTRCRTAVLLIVAASVPIGFAVARARLTIGGTPVRFAN
jgi:hypothetical protein